MKPIEWARVFGVPVVVGALLGLAGGWLWWHWWGPPLEGKIYQTIDGRRQWFPDPLDPGLPHQFGATGTYVIVAIGLGIVLGLLSGWVCRNRALLGLIAVVLGSVAGAVIMALVGQSQSPPDPQEKAETVKIGTKLPEQMELTRGEIELPKKFAKAVGDDDRMLYVPTAQLIWPGAALAGYLLLMLALPVREPDDAPPDVLGRPEPVPESEVGDPA